MLNKTSNERQQPKEILKIHFKLIHTFILLLLLLILYNFVFYKIISIKKKKEGTKKIRQILIPMRTSQNLIKYIKQKIIDN